MDATSIITQVARDDEQLNVYPNEKEIRDKVSFTSLLLRVCLSIMGNMSVNVLRSVHNGPELYNKATLLWRSCSLSSLLQICGNNLLPIFLTIPQNIAGQPYFNKQTNAKTRKGGHR
uniref:Uncharacterized protein n=1 Tax=Glossina brevipalpis TaxID=37001 RepID=A0A1A9WDI0_9MUSC